MSTSLKTEFIAKFDVLLFDAVSGQRAFTSGGLGLKDALDLRDAWVSAGREAVVVLEGLKLDNLLITGVEITKESTDTQNRGQLANRITNTEVLPYVRKTAELTKEYYINLLNRLDDSTL